MCNDHRRCPGCNSERGRAAHNARRRHNRAIKAAVVAHVRNVVGDSDLAAELEAKPPKVAKEWAEAHEVGTDQLGVDLHKEFRIEDQPANPGATGQGQDAAAQDAAAGAAGAQGAGRQGAGRQAGAVRAVRPGGGARQGAGQQLAPGHAAGAQGGAVRPEVPAQGAPAHGQGNGAQGVGRQGGAVRPGGQLRMGHVHPSALAALAQFLGELDPAPRLPRAQSPAPEEEWRQSAQLQGQIAQQLLRQGTNPVERLLLDSPTEKVRSLGEVGMRGGINETRVVELSHGMRAFFKPLSGADRDAELAFGQKNPGQQQIHEVAAWRMAERMGRPYSDLVAPCVLREVDGQLGSLGLERSGSTMVGSDEAMRMNADAVHAAGFFDALIGQQDRHPGNYLVDRNTKRLTLIDHGLSFQTPGSYRNATYLQTQRRMMDPKLSHRERQVLTDLMASPDCFGLQGVLEPERVEALRSRARTMLETGEVL